MYLVYFLVGLLAAAAIFCVVIAIGFCVGVIINHFSRYGEDTWRGSFWRCYENAKEQPAEFVEAALVVGAVGSFVVVLFFGVLTIGGAFILGAKL